MAAEVHETDQIHQALSSLSASMCVCSCAHMYVSTCTYVCMVEYMSTVKRVERYSLKSRALEKNQRPTNLPQRDSDN